MSVRGTVLVDHVTDYIWQALVAVLACLFPTRDIVSLCHITAL